MSQRRSALGRGLGALISNPNTTRAQKPSTQPDPPNANPGEAAPSSATDPVPPKAGAAGEPDLHTPNSVHPASATEASNSASTGALEIDINLIDPNPEQPRREFDRVALEQLSRSIGQHGVLQPVVVRRAGNRYELIMGERRFRASQLAGRGTIPAVIAEVDSDDRLELAIVENVQRQDLNPMELAHAYQALADAGNTQDAIGRKVAMDRSSVANHLRLLDLSRAIQGDVENGRLSLGHAKALLQVTDLEVRETLHGRILSEGLSVRASERAARDLKSGGRRTHHTPKAKVAPAPLDPDTRAYIERIERHLQTKVTLHPTADGSGRLEIKFFNLEDLERIGGMLLGDRG